MRPPEQTIRDVFAAHGLEARLHIMGVLEHDQLADALHAMDVFAFASKSETQGMVLTEAMAAGVPVVALDAPGAREVVKDRVNGRLLSQESSSAFADALAWIAAQSPRKTLDDAALQTAKSFSMNNSARKALACYRNLQPLRSSDESMLEEHWHATLELIKAEWDIIKGVGSAANAALSGTDEA